MAQLVAREAHNLEVIGSSPFSATNKCQELGKRIQTFCWLEATLRSRFFNFDIVKNIVILCRILFGIDEI